MQNAAAANLFRQSIPGASISVAAFAVATLALSIWELYVGGVRPLDFLGLAVLAVSMCAPLVAREMPVEGLRNAAPVILFGIVYVIAGITVSGDNVKGGIGIALGLITFAIVYAWPITRRQLLAVLNVCIALHLTCFWIQLLAYRLAGVFINYLAFAGLQPRAFSQIFRPVGLFMEPATFSLFAVMMIALRYRLNRAPRALDFFLAASAVASLSLWGFVACAAVICYTNAKRAWLWLIAGTVLAVAAIALPFTRLFQQAPMMVRLGKIGTDASARERYGVADRILDLGWSFNDWFGHGVTTDYVAFGENGWSYSLVAVGAAGMICLLLWASVRSERGVRLFVPFVIALCLTAGSLWTGFWWWWWIALLTRRDESYRPAVSTL